MPNPAKHSSDVATSVLTSTLAGWRGTSVVSPATPPEKNLELYDIEGSPYCRAVREVLTALSLDVIILPCPKGGQRFRPEAKRLGGKLQFPLLIDPNTDTVMYESADIVAYLFRTYGNRPTPKYYLAKPWTATVSGAGSALRGWKGVRARPAKVPEQRLELWSFESSPYSRLVRERLTELELPYLLHNIGKEQFADMGPATMRVKPGPYVPKPGGKRERVLAKLGKVQVPYLEDPNTGTALFESSAIIDYLEKQYAL